MRLEVDQEIFRTILFYHSNKNSKIKNQAADLEPVLALIFTESSLGVKLKHTWLILLSRHRKQFFRSNLCDVM